MTRVERQLLINQFKLLALLDHVNKLHYNQKIEVLESGHASLYENVFSGLDDSSNIAVANETHAILSMFRHLDDAMARLPAGQREQFDFRFEGFDANNDPHYFFAKFIIEKQGLYDEYVGKVLNSHSSGTLRKYRAMVARYDALSEQGDLGLLELEQIAAK